ncbi:uncharacterized protein LOC129608107 [Condylostylus longicornis]|uniref:uncharacterized protein LOC129608107 n=1 Tax=Condylostylus longicornis TaxID=2530218 RepID=UPI00244E5B2F|nr:uncharacterized protein LOC129608107 [Condylostylus longicornis]
MMNLFNELWSSGKGRHALLLQGHTPKGGEVLIAVKNSLSASIIDIQDSDDLEIIAVKIELKSKMLFVVNCYIPPNSSNELYAKFSSAIDYLCNSFNPEYEVFVFGDFNLPKIRWKNHDEEPFLISIDCSSELKLSFIDTFHLNNLQQISSITNHQSIQLDLVFTSNWYNCLPKTVPDPLVNVDIYHPPISFSYCIHDQPSIDEPLFYRFDFKRANFALLNDFFSTYDFSSVFNLTDIESMTVLKTKDTGSGPPWVSQKLRVLRNKKNKLWRKYLSTKGDRDYDNFRLSYDQFKLAAKERYDYYIYKTSDNLIRNPKVFWNFINHKRKSDSYPTFLKFDENTSNNSQIISEFFRNFFAESYSFSSFQLNVDNFRHIDNYPKTTFTNFATNSFAIEKYLSNLGSSPSPGPDGVPEIILSRCLNYDESAL